MVWFEQLMANIHMDFFWFIRFFFGMPNRKVLSDWQRGVTTFLQLRPGFQGDFPYTSHLCPVHDTAA